MTGQRKGEPGIARAPKGGGRPSRVGDALIAKRDVEPEPTKVRKIRAIDKRRAAEKGK